MTYHFERVQFLLDLLREHRCQPVAGGNLSAAIVVGSRPGVVELDARAKGDVFEGSLRCTGQAPRARVGQARGFGEVVRSAILHRGVRSAVLHVLVNRRGIDGTDDR